MKKRSLALILALTLVLAFALTGCGGNKDREALVGTWAGTLELADYINQELAGSGMEDYLSLDTFPMVLQYTFNSDGTYSAGVDEGELDKAMEGMKTEMKDGLTKYAEDMIAEQGLDLSVDELFQFMGTSLDDLLEQSFAEMDMSELVDEMASEGNFEAKEGKLFLSAGKEYKVDPEIYDTYTLEGDTLTLTESFGGDDSMNDLYPITMTRK